MASQYGSVPQPDETHLRGGYGGTGAADFARGGPRDVSPLTQHSHLQEDREGSPRGSSGSTAVNNSQPSRSGTLKKKASVKRNTSLRRSNSRKSLRAGSIKGIAFTDDTEDPDSVYWTPVPTSGTPTEVLADRFQAWRQLLKSLVAYFREVQSSYEARSKALHKLHNTVTNITYPTGFISTNGIGEATRLLDDYHKKAIAEANKSQEIEEDVIGALTGLRSDLGQKIKEIKGLSGDFKNSVDKERETTLKEIDKLRLALEQASLDGSAGLGKNDPYVVRLGVERAIEKQIDEENYLHRAYLNLESSGRELESIIVGEIQKAYKALAGILRREGDESYNVVEELRAGPISMPKDQEWSEFVSGDPHFVSPDVPLRRIQDISYPGKHNPAAAEIRAGMLERKSKYLKSYTAGWYVLSPTHLHEFKSADRVYSQPPVMSLYLGDQRLGSHSELGSSSHKFMLKGRQAGSMHKGHNWVFRAESHDTMLAWFNDIKLLTEGSAGEKRAFVSRHTRSASNASSRRSFSSDGFGEEDDADSVPYDADVTRLAEQNPVEPKPQRPTPGGRFPSDLQIPRMAPLSPSSDSSGADHLTTAAIISSPAHEYERRGADPYRLDGVDAGSRHASGVTTIVSQETYSPTGSRHVSREKPVEPLETYVPTTKAAVPTPEPPVAPVPQHTTAEETAVEVTGGTALIAGAEVIDSHHSNVAETDRHAGSRNVDAVLADPIAEQDTAKVLIDSPQTVSNTSVPATIPPALFAAEPAAVLVSEPASDNDAIPIRPPASVITPAPDAPAARATSTQAVKNADLVSAPPLIGVTDVITPAPDAPASRAASTHAVVNAELVSGTPKHETEEQSALDTERSAESVALPALGGVEKAATIDTERDVQTKLEPARGGLQTDTAHETGREVESKVDPSLGGLEKEGAHYTGRLPKVIRHDTDISVSKLHVPGEFR